MLRDNISRIKERIVLACEKNNRGSEEIVVVAVSKGRPAEQIKEAIAAGITDIGENRVQEALVKYQGLWEIRWHMIGHLQTNKVKDAVKIFDLIQSVDSLRLAAEIDRQAVKISKVQDVLVEIKTSSEATKFGLLPEEAMAALEEIAELKNINIKGLMTIAPLADEPEKARPYFRMLRELRDEINALGITPYPLPVLSMGMTDDFTVAVEEGSTMVRLGRAIFGS